MFQTRIAPLALLTAVISWSASARALEMDTSSSPALLKIEICVHEGEDDVNLYSPDVYPTIGDLVWSEVDKFSRYVFVLTQGAMMVDEVIVNWGGVDCRTSDFDWQVMPDVDCLAANPDDLLACRVAHTRFVADMDPETGKLDCNGKDVWWSQIIQKGTAIKLSEQGLGYEDFGGEGFAHELGHYLMCLSDSYDSDRVEKSFAEDMADNGVIDDIYYKGRTYPWNAVINDGSGFPESQTPLYVYVGDEDISSVMSGAEMPNVTAKRPSNAVYNAARQAAGMPSAANTPACNTRYSDDVTRSLLTWWGPNKIANPFSLPNTDVMDTAYLSSHVTGDMLVNTVHNLPYAMSDWAAMFHHRPEIEWVTFDPGFNLLCKDFNALNGEIGGAYSAPYHVGFEVGSGPGRYFLLDVSGSMSVTDQSGDSAAVQVQEAAREIYGTASQVAHQEVIGIALYNNTVTEILDYDTHALEETLTFDPMGGFRTAAGTTNIVLALETARDEIIGQVAGVTRAYGAQIVLMSDGMQTVTTAVDEVQTAQSIWDDNAIAIDTVGYGRADNAILEAMQHGPNSHDALLMRNPYSLHRLKMTLGEKYVAGLGRQKLLNESGTLPVTGYDDIAEGERVFWHTTTFTVPPATGLVRVGAYPKFFPGSGVAVVVTGPNGEAAGAGLGSNPMMANGDYAAATIGNPSPGTYTVTVYSLGVPGDGWSSAFSSHMDLTAWAEARDVNAAVWTLDDTIDGFNHTDFPVYARLSSPDALTGVDVATDVVAADDSVITSVTMRDDGTAGDQTSKDGIYTVRLPTALFTSDPASVLTLRTRFTTTAATEPSALGSEGSAYEPVFRGGEFTVYAQTTIGIEFDDPAGYAPAVDLGAFGGTAVERGKSYIGYIVVKNSIPSAEHLAVQLGRGITVDSVSLVATSGNKATYMVQFTAASNAALGTRNLAVAFGDVTLRETGFLSVVSNGHGNFQTTCPAGYNKIVGNGFSNVLIGTSGKDCIFGLGGNDQIFGLGGDDVLVGGDGNDWIEGGFGNDTIIGNAGADTVDGDPGNDLILGGPGNDILKGDEGHDEIFGDGGWDALYGQNGDDRLYGGAGRDTLDGYFGDDTLNGGIDVDLCICLGANTKVSCEL